jgi:hypothetical protein
MSSSMYGHLRPGDTFSCERCRAVYLATERGGIETRDEARCTCCGTVMMGWPEDCGFELVKASDPDFA